MLVKFSGHNFSSFLLCPGGPVRLRGKEGAGERSPREPRTGRPGAPPSPGVLTTSPGTGSAGGRWKDPRT